MALLTHWGFHRRLILFNPVLINLVQFKPVLFKVVQFTPVHFTPVQFKPVLFKLVKPNSIHFSEPVWFSWVKSNGPFQFVQPGPVQLPLTDCSVGVAEVTSVGATCHRSGLTGPWLTDLNYLFDLSDLTDPSVLSYLTDQWSYWSIWSKWSNLTDLNDLPDVMIYLI